MEWPKFLPIIAVAALAIGALAVVAGPRVRAQERATEAMYRNLRDQALTASPEELGVEAPTAANKPYAVIMDWPIDDGTATLVTFNTGDASLYLSNGGGVIGGFAHEEVRRAAKALVARSESLARDARPTTASPPAGGEVRFYLRTKAGLISDAGPEDELVEGRHRLAPLFQASQEVIAALRQAQQ